MPSQEDSAQTEDNKVSFDAQPDDVPVLIGPYQIVDQIGQGGFAIVYKAIDTANGRSVALKVLRKDRLTAPPEFRKRLMERERMALKLKHPHIIPVFSVAEYDDVPCIAMELVQGGSLADRLSTWYWRPKLGHILELMAQTAEGLAYLHEKGIVHRDIKPSNLLLSFDDHVYISDYTDLQEIESLYGGTIAGTPEYMAPEVILHPDSADGRADLYSLGIILFQLLLGYPPFQAQSATEVLHLQVSESVPALRGLPFEIALTVRKCLEKDPTDRFADARAFLRHVQQLQAALPTEALDRTPLHFTTRPETRFRPRDTDKLEEASLYNLSEYCPGCHSPTGMSAEYCGICGWDLKQPSPRRSADAKDTRRCPKCGAHCGYAAAFCGTCGISADQPSSGCKGAHCAICASTRGLNKPVIASFQGT